MWKSCTLNIPIQAGPNVWKCSESIKSPCVGLLLIKIHKGFRIVNCPEQKKVIYYHFIDRRDLCACISFLIVCSSALRAGSLCVDVNTSTITLAHQEQQWILCPPASHRDENSQWPIAMMLPDETSTRWPSSLVLQRHGNQLPSHAWAQHRHQTIARLSYGLLNLVCTLQNLCLVHYSSQQHAK